MEKEDYQAYPYAHYSLGSKPKITSDTIDAQIAFILEMINKNPDISVEQLKFLESKIKDKIQQKVNTYLAPSMTESTKKNTRKVGFVEGTKLGGKFRKTRKHIRSKRKHRKR
jgi:hypothetical protein